MKKLEYYNIQDKFDNTVYVYDTTTSVILQDHNFTNDNQSVDFSSENTDRIDRLKSYNSLYNLDYIPPTNSIVDPTTTSFMITQPVISNKYNRPNTPTTTNLNNKDEENKKLHITQQINCGLIVLSFLLVLLLYFIKNKIRYVIIIYLLIINIIFIVLSYVKKSYLSDKISIINIVYLFIVVIIFIKIAFFTKTKIVSTYIPTPIQNNIPPITFLIE